MQRKAMLPKATASGVPRSIDAEARTVEVVMGTDTPVRRAGWDGLYNEVLSFESSAVDLSRMIGAPVLKDHNQSVDSIVGRVESAYISGNQLLGKVRFETDPASEEVFRKVQTGTIKSVSIGYSRSEMRDVSRDSDEIPTYLVSRWAPLELSVVTIPADHKAAFRSENQEQFEVTLISRTENLNRADSAEERMNTKEQRDQIRAEEKARQAEIRKLVREAGLDEKLADEYIERDCDVDSVRTNVQLFAKYSKEQADTSVSSTVRVEVGNGNEIKRRESFINSLANRISPLVSLTDSGRQLRGFSVVRMIESLYGRRLGESDLNLVTRVLQTSDLPLLLADSAEKALQERYKVSPRSWQNWAPKTDTVRNYKQASRLRAGDFEALEAKAEGADYAEADPFGEEKEVVSVGDFGKVYKITDQMLVNDDLSAIQQVINEGANAAARLENQKMYSVLSTNAAMGDTIALFHASHNNLLTVGAIGETTFTEAYKKMRKQTSVDGEDILNLSPAHLIVGPDLEVAARKFLASIAAAQSSDVNPFAGQLKLTVEGLITDDRYYFVADQSLIDSVKLFRLEGREAPVIESRRNFDNDNLELKVKHTCAAKAIDWRGISECKATARE